MKELSYYKELRMRRGSIPVIHDCAVKYHKDSISGVCHPLSSTRNWDVASHLRKLQGNKEKSTSPWPQGNLSPLVERSRNTKPWTSLGQAQNPWSSRETQSVWMLQADDCQMVGNPPMKHTWDICMAKRIRPSISSPMLLKGTDTNNKNIP